MTDNVNENVIMESTANYDLGKGKLTKLGRFYLTNDTLYVRKINQTLQTICMIVGVIGMVLLVNSIFGSTSRDYVTAALKGSLAGAVGAILGIFVSKLIPQKPGEVVFSAPLSDVMTVEQTRIGVKSVLELTLRNGDLYTAALPKPEEWLQALQAGNHMAR